MTQAIQSTETVDIMDRPITYTPFMGNAEIKLTVNMVLKLLAKPTKTGKTATAAQAMKFAKLCEARGLNPWEGDAYLVGYDTKDGPEFNLITAHQAFLKRAEVHPEFDGMESGVVIADKDGILTDQPGDFIANDQTLAGGWARVHFKNRKIPTYRRVNFSTFNTGRSRWEKDPGGMIVKVAEADALRSSFPTKLGGLYLREEFDAMVEVTPSRASVPMPKSLENKLDATDGIQADTVQSHDQSDEESQDESTDDAPDPSPQEQWDIWLSELRQSLGGKFAGKSFENEVKKFLVGKSKVGKGHELTTEQRAELAMQLGKQIPVTA